MSGGWKSSNRRSDLPPNWEDEIQPAVLRRDPVCRCAGCLKCTPVPNGPCRRRSEEADHRGHRRDHRMVMLAGMCKPCHGAKSSREGNAAQGARRAGPQVKHPNALW